MKSNLLATAALGLAMTAAAGTAQADGPFTYYTGATAPTGAAWVEDGANLAGGHLWVSDHLNGFCRLEPNATNTAANLTVLASCIQLGAPGQPAYDAGAAFDGTNASLADDTVFLPDGSSKSIGVQRVKLNPSSKLFNVARTNLNFRLGRQNGKVVNLSTYRPTAAALSPNGDLYVANGRNGSIYRIRNPKAASPTIEKIGSTSDGGGALGLTFVGDDLYIAEETTVGVIRDARRPTCPAVTPLVDRGPVGCIAEDAGLLPVNGFIAPQALVQAGGYLYVGDIVEVLGFDLATGEQVSTIAGVRNVGGLAYRPGDTLTGTDRLFIGDDPTAGNFNAQGHWYYVNQLSAAPAS